MPKEKLPPNQSSTPHILGWGVEHPAIAKSLPQIDLFKWRLHVEGEVDNPVVINWQQFLALPQSESRSDFHCVEGWSVLDQKWQGVRFNTLQEIVKPKRTAAYALFGCADEYTTSLPLLELQENNVILAHRLNDAPLPQPLGGPMRLIVPHKYAYKSAMWVNSITFSNHEKLGFWEKRGYSNSADPWKNDR